MIDKTKEENNSAFADKKTTHPTFLQRSVSAPAIAEHVSKRYSSYPYKHLTLSLLYMIGIGGCTTNI
jgi:hypothetical protein